MASKKEANINIEGDMIVNTGKSSNVNNRETRSASSNNIFDKIIYSADQNKEPFAKNNIKEINDVLKNTEGLVKNLSSVIEKNTKDTNSSQEEKKKKSSDEKKEEEQKRKKLESVLEKYDSFLNKKKEFEENETSLRDHAVNTVKAIPRALDNTKAMQGWKTHGAIAAASAINPLAGAGLQLLLSDQFKGFGSSILKSITGGIKRFNDAKKNKNKLKEKEVELQKNIVDAYKNLSGNVDEVYKRMEGSVKNFNPEQLLLELTTKVKNAKVESKTSNSDSVNGLTEEKITNIVKANSLNKDDVIKVQTQDTRTESEKAVLSSKAERALNGEKEEKKVDSGESFISKLFKNAWSAIKKHWLEITGLILFYFSSDQFKAYVKDLITIPFRRLWKGIEDNGLISGLFSKEGAIAAAVSAALYFAVPKFIRRIFWKGSKGVLKTTAKSLRLGGKFLSKAFKSLAKKGAAKAATKAAVKTAAKKGAAKAVAKGVGKAAAKSGVKKLPVIGALAGTLFAAQRAMAGDWTGAALELASGVAGTLPGLGTAASLGIDAYLMKRDIDKATEEVVGADEVEQRDQEIEAPVKAEKAKKQISLNINSSNKEIIGNINDIFSYNTQYITREITSNLLLLKDVLNQISVNTAGNKIITSSNDSSATMSLPR